MNKIKETLHEKRKATEKAAKSRKWSANIIFVEHFCDL